MYLDARNNPTLGMNPPSGQQHLTTGGSDWLWAVTAVFILAFLALAILTAIHRGERIFHYLFTIALLVGSIAYFAMASDLAWTVVNQRHNGSRQIFFAKYVYWVVSFPVVIIALGLISGVSWATILWNVTLAWIWVLAYLFTAYTASSYKWGFFALGTLAWLLLAHSTLRTLLRGGGTRSSSRHISPRRQKHSTNASSAAGPPSSTFPPPSSTSPSAAAPGTAAPASYGGCDLGAAGPHHRLLALWTNFLWLNYPLAVGLGDGGNRIGVVASLVWLGILDLLMVPVLAAAFLALARRWDYGRLNLAFTQYGRVSAAPGTFPEKNNVHSSSNNNNNNTAAGTGGLAGGPVGEDGHHFAA